MYDNERRLIQVDKNNNNNKVMAEFLHINSIIIIRRFLNVGSQLTFLHMV